MNSSQNVGLYSVKTKYKYEHGFIYVLANSKKEILRELLTRDGKRLKRKHCKGFEGLDYIDKVIKSSIHKVETPQQIDISWSATDVPFFTEDFNNMKRGYPAEASHQGSDHPLADCFYYREFKEKWDEVMVKADKLFPDDFDFSAERDAYDHEHYWKWEREMVEKFHEKLESRN